MFAADRVGDMRYILVFAFWILTFPAWAADVDDLVKAGQEAMARMDVPLAMTHFDNALKAEPTHPQAAYERGRILLKMGDAKNAVADFTTAALTDPKFGLALARRGEAHMVLKNPHAAFKDFDAAIAASPELAEVFMVRATYRFQIGNLVGAKEDVVGALAVADDAQKPVLQKMLQRMQ
jgi:tetratricopeptide (TPR) repeat protein